MLKNLKNSKINMDIVSVSISKVFCANLGLTPPLYCMAMELHSC